MKKMYNKQSKSSENSQHSRPTAVAKGGYPQIVVNPMQLEDEAFTVWMRRLIEARRNRENRVQIRIETFANHTMTNMNHRRNLVRTDTESFKLNRNLNRWQKLKYNQLWMHTGARTKM